MKRYIYAARVINVVDGDTLDLRVDLGFSISQGMRVRLAGIDAAEKNSTVPEQRALAQKSKDRLTELCATVEPCLVETFKVDKYGRYLAEIYPGGDVNGISVSQTLLAENLAVVYNGGKR